MKCLRQRLLSVSVCECVLSLTDVDSVCLTSSALRCHGLVNLSVFVCVCVFLGVRGSPAMAAFIFHVPSSIFSKQTC